MKKIYINNHVWDILIALTSTLSNKYFFYYVWENSDSKLDHYVSGGKHNAGTSPKCLILILRALDVDCNRWPHKKIVKIESQSHATKHQVFYCWKTSSLASRIFSPNESKPVFLCIFRINWVFWLFWIVLIFLPIL